MEGIVNRKEKNKISKKKKKEKKKVGILWRLLSLGL